MEHINRFLASLQPVDIIGQVTSLTNDGRCGYPVFADGDTLVYFDRLLVSDPADTTGRTLEELIKPYGINIGTKELYTLSAEYVYPDKKNDNMEDSIHRAGEEIVRTLALADSQTIIYETVVKGKKSNHAVYIQRGDSTIQLTYGETPCFIDRLSNTSRYISIICRLSPSWIAIYDLREDKGYLLDKDQNVLDYMTMFSADDKMMAFIRSEKKYSIGYDFFGDICVFRFNQR